MYGQSPDVTRAKSFLPSPAPDLLMDYESDLLSILEDKRREIDEEIEAFKLRKEKEFKAFEDDLRSRKRRNTNNSPQVATSLKSGLSNLSKDFHANGAIIKEKKKRKKAEDLILGGLIPTPGPSKPSVSIDRVTINGMTTPPVSGTPPLEKVLSRSPTNLSGTPPCSFPEKELAKPPTPSDRENNFHGLFIPTYLPLIDTQPSSLPQKPTSSSITNSKRSLTASRLPPHSLPSALRAASGTTRKRKHVTFRLAHSVVVDPSSSYEETPSPTDDQYEKDLNYTSADSGIEMLPSPIKTDGPISDPGGGFSSLDKPVNESSFFSFDEELEEHGDKSRDHQIDQEDDAADIEETGQQAQLPKTESLTLASSSLPINIIKPGPYFRAARSG